MDNQKYFVVDLILAERPTQASYKCKGSLQYYTKFQNYPFEESVWIHKSSFNDVNKFDTPFYYWNHLSKIERRKRSDYWIHYFSNLELQTKISINERGWQYLQTFSISTNIFTPVVTKTSPHKLSTSFTPLFIKQSLLNKVKLLKQARLDKRLRVNLYHQFKKL